MIKNNARTFSATSLQKLNTCHPDLQVLFHEVIKVMDCTIIEGHRGQVSQNEAYRTGKSKLQWPNGEHNKVPSLAVDVAPCVDGKINWNDTKTFCFFAGIVLSTASQLGIKIRWGGDWDGDFNLNDQSFNDLPHFELKIEK